LSQPEKKIVKWSDTKVDEISDKTEREHNSKFQEEKRKKTPTTMSREKQNAVWNSQLEQSVEEIPIWRQKRSSCNFTFSSQEPQCTQLTFVYRKHCHYAPA
jgi:hypothetical protein